MPHDLWRPNVPTPSPHGPPVFSRALLDKMLLSIVIPTFRRPELLAMAVESCLGQAVVRARSCEILVIDNAAEGSARDMIQAYANRVPDCIKYVHEPLSGIAHARNAGVRAAGGTFIAFLDDDEIAVPRWAEGMLRHALAGAKAVFGPVEPRFEDNLANVPEATARLFRRNPPWSDGKDITRYSAYLGTGNSLFDRAACFPSGTPFSIELEGLGGEDSDFLFRLVHRGVRLTWAADALVTEFVPHSRTTPTYVARRHLRNGQIRSLVHFRANGLQAMMGVLWMGIGFVQALTYGSASIALSLLRQQRAEDMKFKAMSGVGKVFWMKPFWHISYTTFVKAAARQLRQ